MRRLLRQGAAGQFDHHYKALAERLVALKVPDTVIVLGWEMNGTTYTHRCGPDPLVGPGPSARRVLMPTGTAALLP